MKKIYALLAIFSICALVLEFTATWRIKETKEGFSIISVRDGGSIGIEFSRLWRGEALFLDRGFEVVGKDEKGNDIYESKEDGLLYWSGQNFEQHIPLDLNSSLAMELESSIWNYLEDQNLSQEELKTEYWDLQLILNSFKRIRSNKTRDQIASSGAAHD